MSTIPGTDYADLTDDEQAEALRPVALDAAAAFGLEPERLDLLTHAYNTTFALATPTGERYALRVNTNSSSSAEEIVTQQLWQLAIAEQTPVRVAVPRATTDGAWSARVASRALGRETLVTCASWLEGPDADDLTPEIGRALGRAMAQLHEHARSLDLPRLAHLRTFVEPLLGDEDRITGEAGLDAEQREVVAEAMARTTAAFARDHAAGPVIPLHADLHGANLKWHDGCLAVFDFDDCGLGTPAYDLSVTTFYLRRGDGATEESVRAGYAEVAPLPHAAGDDFEAMVASRQLLLGNDLLGSSTAALRAQSQTYLVRSVDRLRHWLETGHFSLTPPAR
ncbi:phosphotransferase enzyme family protein [Ornithinimicrobium tianjinense]|uniref:Aminoglycoside phosphotransferase n=1 Tax=Ornithinimicrobium tianjinense TaxID=1195761 RepID=A0A917BS68_9MICO|nr:phosphotransferase [Ornithinimicrobium tianjinense]GGF52444.1 aminoglycoside phosphotransferase [Ornithinimicrobium tianjinense]